MNIKPLREIQQIEREKEYIKEINETKLTATATTTTTATAAAAHNLNL